MTKIRPPKQPPKVRIQVDMPADMGKEVKALALHDGRSMSATVIMLLDRAITPYKQESGLLNE